MGELRKSLQGLQAQQEEAAAGLAENIEKLEGWSAAQASAAQGQLTELRQEVQQRAEESEAKVLKRLEESGVDLQGKIESTESWAVAQATAAQGQIMELVDKHKKLADDSEARFKEVLKSYEGVQAGLQQLKDVKS